MDIDEHFKGSERGLSESSKDIRTYKTEKVCVYEAYLRAAMWGRLVCLALLARTSLAAARQTGAPQSRSLVCLTYANLTSYLQHPLFTRSPIASAINLSFRSGVSFLILTRTAEII